MEERGEGLVSQGLDQKRAGWYVALLEMIEAAVTECYQLQGQKTNKQKTRMAW